MTNNTFDEVFSALKLTNEKHNHCFANGCGKKTLKWWMYRSTGLFFSVGDVRRALKKAEQMGLIVKGVSNYGGYSTYTFVI